MSLAVWRTFPQTFLLRGARARRQRHSLSSAICTKYIGKLFATFSLLPLPLRNKPGYVRMAHQGGCLCLVFVLLCRTQARARQMNRQMGAIQVNGGSSEPALPIQRVSTDREAALAEIQSSEGWWVCAARYLKDLGKDLIERSCVYVCLFLFLDGEGRR